MEGGGRRYSEETAHDIDQAVKERLDAAFAHAKEILERRRDDLDAYAKRLLAEENLDEEDLAPLRRRVASGSATAGAPADTPAPAPSDMAAVP
jgi:cell division protease FtsH